jgi:hypothetical protein
MQNRAFEFWARCESIGAANLCPCHVFRVLEYDVMVVASARVSSILVPRRSREPAPGSRRLYT